MPTSEEHDESVSGAAAEAARMSYGRLVALLAVQWRDVSAAEDAIQDAFAAAMRDWPVSGIPEHPEAWLMTAARRRMIDAHRRDVREAAATRKVQSPVEVWQDEAGSGESIPDERLNLLLLCAHPAIDASLHSPLMLQCVLGLEASEIASAFLVPPSTMAQRLVRAKAKIREAGLRFELPEREELSGRLGAVLVAVYAAFNADWDSVPGNNAGRGLGQEAIWLGRVLAGRMPEEPEVLGLLALMLYCHARRSARRVDGRYVPLTEQDCKRWNRSEIAEAERLLKRAAQARAAREDSGLPGRFQLEAAIQSVHAARALTGEVDWSALMQLYRGLLQVEPSIGALVGCAAVTAEVSGAREGLEVLDRIQPEDVVAYQPYWATRGVLLIRAGQMVEGCAAIERACGLTEDEAVRRYLFEQIRAGRARERGAGGRRGLTEFGGEFGGE